MIDILAEVHYLPDTWRGQAHTTSVRDQFSQFFQYKAVSESASDSDKKHTVGIQ